MSSNLKAQGTKAFIWDFFGKMTTHGIGFVVTIFLARLLEPSDFGLIAMVMVVIGMAGVFMDVGLSAALIQRQRLRPVHFTSVFYFNITIGLLLTLLTYFSAPLISTFYGNGQLLPLVQTLSLLFVVNAFSSVQTTLLRRALNYARLTKIGLFSSLSSGLLGVSLAFWGAGVWSLVAQTLTMAIVYNILLWYSSAWKPSQAFSWKALTQLWGFGFRMFLSNILDTVFTRLDYLIIGKLFAPATLGFFQRAKSLNNMVIQYSSGSLMAVLFPVLSSVQKDLPRFQKIVIKALGVINFVVFMLLGGLYLVSEELIILLFSDKWLPSVAYFKILVLSGFAFPLSALLVNVLSSRGNSKAFLRLEIYKKLVASINFVVLYLFGIHIFLYGLIIQATLNLSLNILFASREMKLSFLFLAKPIIVQAFITVNIVILTLLINQNCTQGYIIFMFTKGIMFVVFYFLVNYLFKTAAYLYFMEQVLPIIQKVRLHSK